jgi:hypothetical protein
MAQFADIEGLRQATSLQTELVWREVRLTEDAIRRGRIAAIAEDSEGRSDTLHVLDRRPTAVILPFPRAARRRPDQ